MKPYISKIHSPVYFTPTTQIQKIHNEFILYTMLKNSIYNHQIDLYGLIRNQVRDNLDPLKLTLLRIIKHRRF